MIVHTGGAAVHKVRTSHYKTPQKAGIVPAVTFPRAPAFLENHMKRLMPVTLASLLCLTMTTFAADTPADLVAKSGGILKDRGVLPFVDRVSGFIYLVVKQDTTHIEKAYGINDQIKDMVSAPELTEVLKSVDTALPFDVDVIAFDILDTQTCSLLFVIHGTEGPIGIKVYMQPSKTCFVHRVEIILDWEEIEKLAHRMEKLPIGYTVTITKLQEDRP